MSNLMKNIPGIFRGKPQAPTVVTAPNPVVPITIAVDVSGGAAVTIGEKQVTFTSLANYKNEEAALNNLKTNYTAEAAKKKTEDDAAKDRADMDELKEISEEKKPEEATEPASNASVNGAQPNKDVNEPEAGGGAATVPVSGTEPVSVSGAMNGGKRRRKTNKRKRAQNRKGRRTMNHRGWH